MQRFPPLAVVQQAPEKRISRGCNTGNRDGDMTPEDKFSQAEKDMAEHRRATLDRVEGCSQTQLDFKPAAHSWSIGEVAHHLYLGEKTVQETVRDLMQSGDVAHREISVGQL